MRPKITEVLNSPFINNLIEKKDQLLENKQLLEKLTEILSNINYKELLIFQTVVFLSVILLRSYVFSRTKGFLINFFTEIWTLAVMLSLLLFFVPLYIIGFNYLELVKILFIYFF